MPSPRVVGDTPTHSAIIDWDALPWDLSEKWAWAAGFFDGEGSIGIERRPDRTGGRLVVTVVQKHPEPLERLRDWLGGHVDWQSGSGVRGTPRWRWRAASGTALAALARMRPYLVVKAAEADIAIAFQRNQRQGRKRSPAEVDCAREALTALKRREGVTPNVPVAA